MANIETLRNESVSPSPAAHEPEVRYQAPPTDVLESESSFLLLADMPGVAPEAVSIHLDGSELAIEGQAKTLDGSPVTYRRVFKVGPGIDANGITAELKQGVLHLVAKKSEALKPRQIAVKAG